MGDDIIYNIKQIDLDKYIPDFLENNKKHLVHWFFVPHIPSRIQTFLSLIAKVNYKNFNCYCCSYPHETSADYIVFVDIDNGKNFMLISTIKDTKQYPDSWKKIERLKNDLIFIQVSYKQLLIIHQEIVDQLHQDE